MERTDLTQVENRQGKRTRGRAEIAGIDADETHADPQPPRIVAQRAACGFAGDPRGSFALMRLRQRLRHGVARGRLLPWIECDDDRAEQDKRRHRAFEHFCRQFQQQQPADDATDQSDAGVDGHAHALASKLPAGGKQSADARTAHAHRVRGVGQHRRNAERQQRRIGYQRGCADRVSNESRPDAGCEHQQQCGDGHSRDHDRFSRFPD